MESCVSFPQVKDTSSDVSDGDCGDRGKSREEIEINYGYNYMMIPTYPFLISRSARGRGNACWAFVIENYYDFCDSKYYLSCWIIKTGFNFHTLGKMKKNEITTDFSTYLDVENF